MRLCTSSLALLGLFSLAALSPVQAQVTAAPALMNFQGRLARPDGTPVADGTYSVRFSLWNAVSAGTQTWIQTVGNVTVKNGTFAVQLSGFPANAFHSSQWLEIKIGSDPALAPRQQLVSVAYAMKANSVPDGSIGAAQIANGSLTADKFASGALNNLSWLLSGNNITDPNTQFLGTTNNQPLVFRTNNTEKMRLESAGNLVLSNGVIQQGGSSVTATADLGLYSQINGSWMRFVTTAAPFHWYSDGGGGTTPIMTLAASGNLGIGTTTPASKLHVISGLLASTAGSTLPLTSLTGYASNGVTLNTFLQRSAEGTDWTTAPIILQRVTDVTNQAMLSFHYDNIGIGTATPADRLHVSGGNIRLDANQELFFADNGQIRSADNNHRILFRRSENTMELREFGNIVFSPGSTGTETAKVVMLANGNVGIGVVAPTAKLDVNGIAQMTGFKLATGAAAGRVLTSDASGIGTWQVAAGAGWNLTGNAGTNPSTQFLGTTDAQPLVFRTGNTEKLRLLANGNVGIGTATPGVKLDVAGEIRGTVITITGGSDVAEPYEIASAGDVKPIPGYVVAIDSQKVGQMRVAARAYDKTVAGIVSGANGINPGITLRQKGTIADGSLPVASIGRVWCWCDADQNGAIEAGDMLTTSDTPGHAMKVSDYNKANGSIIGKAMSSLKSGKGLVLVLVSLK